MKRALYLFFAIVFIALGLPIRALASGPTYVQNCAYAPGGTSTGTTTPISCSSAPTAGDEFVVGVHLATGAAVTITTPSGTWNLVDTCVGGGKTLAVYTHTITSADNSGNSFSWSWVTAYYSHINMVEISGGGAVDAHICANITSSGSSPQTITSGSVTPTATNDLPIFFSASTNITSSITAGSASGGSSGSCSVAVAGSSGGIYQSVEYCPATTSTSATTATETYGNYQSGGYETEFLLIKASISLYNGLALTGAGGPHQSIPVLVNPGTHVQTLVYGWGWGTAGVSSSVPIATQAPWLTFAYNSSNHATYDADGVLTIGYTNFNLCYPTDYPLTCYYELAPLTVCQSNASTYGYSASNCTAALVSQAAQNCSGSYVYDPAHGGGYINAPYVSTTNYAQIASDQMGSPGEDYIFADDTGSNGPFTNGILCNNGTSYSSSLWVTQMQTAIGDVTGKPLFINSLNAEASGLNPSTIAPVANNSNVVADECEGCFINSGAVQSSTNWTLEQDGCLIVQSYNKMCLIYAKLAAITASNSAQQRLYSFASFLLTYGGSTSIFQYYISGLTSQMMVMPEEELVPTNPVESLGTDVTVLASGSGYIRHYTDCYYDAVDQGACAIVVNPSNSTSMTISTTGYSHALSIGTGTANSDIIDGGSISLTGTPSTTVATQSAEILLQ